MKFLNLLSTSTKTSLGTAALLLATTQVSFGQTTQEKLRIANSYNQEELKKLEVQYATQASKELEAAKKWAKENNAPLQIERKNGTVDHLQKVVDGSPIYYSVGNVGAAKTTRANTLNTGGQLNLNVNGENMTVGIWDGGSIRTTHQAFGTRATAANGSFSTCDGNTGHATHVAGTMVAGSAAGNAQGMAPAAAVVSYDWNNDLSEVSSQASNGLLLSNHSYGYAVVDDNGNLIVQKHIIGKYTQDAAAWDNLMYQAPYYQMVNAAGNDRDYQAAITNKGGYDLLAGHSVSKNAIVVAAAYEVANYTSASSVSMSSFSNWGPTDDGRIKPDIAGKGVDVYSSYCSSNTSYANLSGTSMASPNVTGTLLLLQQHYKNVNGSFMYASMLRGLAIHTADEAGAAAGPDYKYGWGLLNAKKAAQLISNNNTTAILTSKVLSSGQSYTTTVTAGNSGPLEVTICWTDPQGTAITNTTIDPTTAALVNDLDVRITNGGTTYYPWKLNVASPSAAATQADNNRDNVEKIYIASPTPGAVYTITVTHKNTLYSGSQRFAFIVSGITTLSSGGGGGTGITYCDSKGNSTADEWINRVQVGTFSNISTQAQSATGYTNYTTQTINATTGANSITLTPGHAATAYNEYWKIWIDFNGDGDFVDAGEQVYDHGVLSSTAVTGTMTIPTSAVGLTRRMRVSMKYNAAQTGPCEVFGYGEVEDYMISITAPTGGGGGGSYCASAGGSTADEWIARVQIGTYSNASTQAQSSTGYTNYTTSPAINIPAGANNVTLTPGFTSSAYNEYWKIWMDLNNDNDFVDAGELVYDHGALSNAAVTGVMTIPTTAAGITTRMRVSMKYNAAQTGPCEAFGYGEVEDYTVNITASTGGGNPTTPPTGYCASNGSDNNYEWIDLVEFGAVSNVTARATGGYGNHTNLTGNLNIGGASQSVYVSAAFASTAYMEYWRVWIDLNRDGDFNDAGELLGSANSNLATKLRISITVPATASAGVTRMRVSMKYNAAQTGPCEVFQYGEVEDYLVNLVSSSNRPAEEGSTIAASREGSTDIFDEYASSTPEIFIYPNPAIDQIALDIDRREGDVEYSIQSIQGATVKTGTLYGRDNLLTIDELAAGTYLITAKNGQHVWTTKFVKLK